MMKVRLLQADVPNANGRVYPREALEAALKNIPQGRLFAQFGMPVGTTVDLAEVAAAVGNFEFDSEGYLVAEVVPMSTPKGEVLSEMLTEKTEFDYRPAGIGKITPQGHVYDYKFVSIGVLQKGTGA